MLNPDLKKLLDENDINRYSLVVATAKLARQIAEEAQENHNIIIQKPVTIALEEIMKGNYKITESTKLEKIEDDEIKDYEETENMESDESVQNEMTESKEIFSEE